MGRHHHAVLPVLAAAAVAVLAAGCGSSGGVHDSGSAGSPSASHHSADAAPDSKGSDAKGAAPDGGKAQDQNTRNQSTQDKSAKSNAAGTGRTDSSVPWCGTKQLSLSLHGLNPAAGNRYAAAVLTNTSKTSCRTEGYIGMQLLSGSGGKVPTDVVRDHSKSATTLTLAPNGSAWAQLHWGAVAGSGDSTSANCQPSASQVQVTPPDSYTQEQSKWSYGPVCEKGRISVLPLASGTGPAY